MSEHNLDDTLRKIQGLIDKAHGTDNDFERAAFLAKADAMMVSYSVEASMLESPDRNRARARPVEPPEMRHIVILDPGLNSELDYHVRWGLERIFGAVAEHLFVRRGPTQQVGKATVVGYPTDLRFCEMFFLKIKLHMFSEMVVTVDSSKPWVEVMAGLKNMGYRWQDIHQKLQAHDGYPYQGQWWERKFGVKFTSEMKKWTEANGTPRNKSSNPSAWRADYVDGYVTTVVSRLWRMRQDTLEANPLLPDLIGGKKSQVDEAFWDFFPDLRPHPENCECDTCHYRKCKDRTCTRPRCEQARKPVRSSGGSIRYRKLNMDAHSAGTVAGQRADLTDKGPLG